MYNFKINLNLKPSRFAYQPIKSLTTATKIVLVYKIICNTLKHRVENKDHNKEHF